MKKANAQRAIHMVAINEKATSEEVRKEIKRVVQIGLSSNDPNIKAKWEVIPCEGDAPTPEELIMYLAEKIREHRINDQIR